MGSTMNFQNFQSALISGFKNATNFKGRATREEYWLFFIFYQIVLNAVRFLAFTLPFEVPGLGATTTMQLIVTLLLFLPMLAVGVRRMHDVNKSGVFLLVPIYNIILLASPSQPEDNFYGPLKR